VTTAHQAAILTEKRAIASGAVDEEVLEVSPDNLAEKLSALRTKARAVFAKECETTNFPPMAEQYYRLALAAIEQAESFARLADYNLSRGE
jgi:hypothetical protein